MKQLPQGFILEEEKQSGYKDLPEGFVMQDELPEAGYGEVFTKAIENVSPATRVGLGGTLQGIEETPIEGLKNIIASGEKSTGILDFYKKGLQGLVGKAQIVSTLLPALFSPGGKEMREEAQKELEANQPNVPKGSLKDYIGSATTSVAQNAIPLVGSILTKNPFLSLGAAGVQSFGQSYGEQRDAGQTPSQAFLPALGSAGAEVAMEKLPLGILMKEGGTLFGRALKSVGAEGATESLTSFVQDGIRKGTITPDMTFGQMMSNAKDAGIVGMIAGGAMGAAAHPFSRGKDKVVAPDGAIKDDGEKTNFNLENELNKPLSKDGLPAVDLPTVPAEATGFVREGEAPVSQVDAWQKDKELPTFRETELSPVTDIDTAHTTLDAIRTGNMANINPDVVNDLVKSGEIQTNEVGQPVLTDLGSKLLDAINREKQPIPVRENVPIQEPIAPELQTPAMPDTQDRISTPETQVGQDYEQQVIAEPQPIEEGAPYVATPEEEKEFLNYQTEKQDVPFSVTKKTDTPEFKNWFGESKVVDEKGEPLVVYHGTGSDVDVFKTSGGSGKTYGTGAFFSSSPDVASTYATGNQKNVSPVHLSLKNPVVIDANGKNWSQLSLDTKIDLPETNVNNQDEYADLLNQLGVDVSNIPKERTNKSKSTTFKELFGNELYDDESLSTDDIVRWAKKQGYESVVIKNVVDRGPSGNFSTPKSNMPTDIYVAFDPTQVKSAIGNNGNYNPEDPNISHSVTPTEKLTANKEVIKDNLNKIIRRINPSVKTEFSDKMFGEGEALKASGAKTTERQEVAGSFNALHNLIKASLNVDKFDPTDTAYHEAYHSIRDMANDADDAVLKKAFPGTDRYSQSEHEAIEFARFMTEKNAKGFSPAVRRIFLAIKQALRDIGRSLKLGGFNSIEDIFNRVERGSVYSDYQNALRNGDIQAIRDSTLTPEQQQEAIKQVSPTLHDIVYSGDTTDAKDRQALLNIAANTTEEGALSAVRHQLENPTTDDALHKITKKYLEYSMTPKEADEYIKIKGDIVDDLYYGIMNHQPMQALGTIGSIMFNGNDTNVRAFARRAIDPVTGQRKTSQSMIDFADTFVPAPGSGDFQKPTYYDVRNDFAEPEIARIEKIGRSLSDSEWKDITRLLQDPELRYDPKSKLGNAANELRLVLHDTVQLAEKYGTKIEETLGYFPRDYLDDDILANPDQFLADAEKAFEATARYWAKKTNTTYVHTPELAAEYKEYANSWLERVRWRNKGIDVTGDTFSAMRVKDDVPVPPSLKNRPLSKEADDIMRRWLNQDAKEVLVNHIDRLSKKVAFDHFYGGDKFINMQKSWADEGVDPSDIERARKILAINTGIAWSRISQAESTALGFARMFSVLRFLSKSGRNAISETAHIATQSGDLMHLGSDFANLGKAFATKIAKGKLDGAFPNMAHAVALIESMGIVSDFNEINMINSRTELNGRDKYQRMMTKAFKTFQTAPITRASEVAAYLGADRLINQLSRDIVSHGNTYESAVFMTRGLGIPENRAVEFAEWVLKNPMKEMKEDTARSRGDMETMYRMAVRRHISVCIQRPTPAVKALYATNPYASLIYGLSSFFYSSENNILRRNYRMAKSAITGKTMSGSKLNLTARDRVRMAYPMALTVTVLPLIMGAFKDLWDEVYKNPEKRKEDITQKIFSSFMGAGSFGRFSGMVGAFQYNNPDQIMEGPLVSSFMKIAKDLRTPNFKGGTYVNKRALTKDLWDSIVIPTANYGIVASPLPTPVAFTAIQLLNQPRLKNKVADTVAGKKKSSYY